MASTIPWVEKYRPTSFDDIVLDETNQRILKNIIETDTFPNLLLYGPPGTGKTTTVINLINAYQSRYNQSSKGLTIHLNASDERGIDVIRSQISLFVNSQSLFTKGLKVVVLDEVDYMTKNAQQALKYLLQEFTTNVRFCLICNYISRIDESLRNEFLQLRFNQLPPGRIVPFLQEINNSESLGLSHTQLAAIQSLFKSDIRSMINYMQSNSGFTGVFKVVDNGVWDGLTETIREKGDDAVHALDCISREYNLDVKNIMKDYLSYVISKGGKYLDRDFLQFAQFLMHLRDPDVEYLKTYFVSKMEDWVCS